MPCSSVYRGVQISNTPHQDVQQTQQSASSSLLSTSIPSILSSTSSTLWQSHRCENASTAIPIPSTTKYAYAASEHAHSTILPTALVQNNKGRSPESRQRSTYRDHLSSVRLRRPVRTFFEVLSIAHKTRWLSVRDDPIPLHDIYGYRLHRQWPRLQAIRLVHDGRQVHVPTAESRSSHDVRHVW